MSRRSINALLWCGAIGPPLFVVAFVIEGATRRGYDAVRLPVSLLALGDLGWTQTLNFLVFGVLTIAFAAGLWSASDAGEAPSRLGTILIGIFGVGIVGAGLFAGDPGGGYPPGARGPGPTGTLHDLATLILFTSLAIAAAAFSRQFAARGDRAWAIYSALTAAAIAGGFVLMFIGFSGTNEVTRVAGVVQRVTIVIGWAWVSLLAVREIRAHQSQAD